MTKVIASAACVALKEALSTVYRYKSDLRSFLTSTIAKASGRPSSTCPLAAARTGKITGVKRAVAEILKDALALPSETRAALAASLLESLDTEVDEDADDMWATEINRRVAELDSAAVKTFPGTKCGADSSR